MLVAASEWRLMASEERGKLPRTPIARLALAGLAVVIVGAAAAVVLMDQLRTEVLVSSGSSSAGSWSVWTYEAFNRGICLEIRAADREERRCAV